MIVNIVHVFVNQESLNEFIEITKYNHENTINEPGNLRFDVLQDKENPDKFVLYEVFKTEEDVKLHKETKHYKKWRETVAGWMTNPRIGTSYNSLFPKNELLW